MKQQLFRVSAKHKETTQQVTLHVWAENVDVATNSLTPALFGEHGAYWWMGSGPEYKNNEVITREI